MGRKKFNKKDATVYHLVRRSQRDVGGYIDEKGNPIDMPSDFVLIPSEDTLKRAQLKQEQHILSSSEKKKNSENEIDHHNNTANDDDALARARKKLTQANLVDEYDYEQHMAPISASGVFINNETQSNENHYTNLIRSKNLDLIDPMIKEVDRQYDSIALTADCMDEDVAHALFGDFENGEFEEILDDFCITANQEEPIHLLDEMTGGGDGADEDYEGKNQTSSSGGTAGILDFDFDAHIERLIAKAKSEENGGSKVVPKGHEAWTQQQNVFQNVKPLKNKKKHLDDIDEEDDDEDSLDREFGHHHQQYHDDDLTSTQPDYFTMEENPGIVSKLNPEEEKVLCEKFEQTLLEYDSDELGDLDDEYMNIRGDKPLEGDQQIEAALDQFLQQKKDDNFVMGTNQNGPKRVGGSSMVFVNKKLVPYNAIDKVEGGQEEKIEDVLKEADKVLANPEMDLPPEEVLIDGKSYFTLKERNPWDCESILSTYSNLDNNPAVVGRSGRRKKKKNKNSNSGGGDFDIESIAEEKPLQILLSNKTGMPLGVLPTKGGVDDDDYGEETFISVNKGEARKKSESKEEKRARKLLVKQERQIARIQKKMMREAIAEEFGQRVQNDVSNEVGGKSVFKYS